MWWFMSQFISQIMPLCFCFMCGLLRGKSKTCITSYTELGDPFLQHSPLQVSPLPHFIALRGPFFYFLWSECWVSLRVVVPLRLSCSSISLGLPSRQESEKKLFLSEFFLFTLTMYLCNMSYPWVKTYYKRRKQNQALRYHFSHSSSFVLFFL